MMDDGVREVGMYSRHTPYILSVSNALAEQTIFTAVSSPEEMNAKYADTFFCLHVHPAVYSIIFSVARYKLKHVTYT